MKDADHTVTGGDETAVDGDQTARLAAVRDKRSGTYRVVRDDQSGRGDSAPLDERYGDDLYAGLTSLGFVQAALRRRLWFWLTLAVVGLAAGVGLYKFLPVQYQAETQIVLGQPPDATIGWIADDQAIAQSRTVAAKAIRTFQLNMNPDDLVKHYTVTAVADHVLQIGVNATSATNAVKEANALAQAFITFRAELLNKQEHLVNTSLDDQIAQLGPSMPKRKLALFKQTINGDEASLQEVTATAVQRTNILDHASLVKHSQKKRIALFAGGGLLAGLVIGIGLVVIGALMSDRLRRRDEVARAMGVPVRMSVGKLKVGRGRRRGLAASQKPRIRQIVANLSTAVAPGSGEPASLAVVAVGEQRVPAACVASLAMTYAREGARVLVADLSPGAPAARVLGAPAATGVLKVNVDDSNLVVVVPEPDDAAPAGPLRRGPLPADEQITRACGSADVLLTLATLDPALGADHLPSWASSAVALVTAGESSAAGIHSVGEMLKIAGMPSISAVVIGADRSDESLGVTLAHGPAGGGRLGGNGVPANGGQVLGPFNGRRPNRVT